MFNRTNAVLMLTLFAQLGLIGDGAWAAQYCRSATETERTTPTSEFIDHGDGTVTHNKSGLMWMKCSIGQTGDRCDGEVSPYKWPQAEKIAKETKFAGYSDWRLPTREELKQLVEHACYEPAINMAVFPATPSKDYWTSTPYGSTIHHSWYVSFSYGYAYHVYKQYTKRMRLVRSSR